MRTLRNLGLIALALIGTGLTPAAAQNTGAAPLPDSALTLVFIVFPDTVGAQQAYTNLSTNDQATAGHIQDYAVVSRGKDGKVAVQQSSAANSSDRAISGVESSLGAQANPSKAGASGNAANQSGVSSQNLSKMRQLLKPGTSAIVAVTMEPYLPSVVRSVQRGQEMPIVQAAILPTQQ